MEKNNKSKMQGYNDIYYKYNKYNDNNRFSYEAHPYHESFRRIPFVRLNKMLNKNRISLDNKKVLIASSGSGVDAHYLKRLYKGIQLYFSDINLASMEKLHSNFKKGTAALSDNHYMAFKDNSFDFVFIAASIHHLKEPIRGLYEFIRIAKEGVIVIEPNDSWLVRFFEFFGWASEYEVEHDNYVYRFNKRDIHKIAKALFYDYDFSMFFAIHKKARTAIEYLILKLLNGLGNLLCPSQGNYILFLIKKNLTLPKCMKKKNE